MRKNRIFAMAEKVHLNDTSKKRIKALLHSVEAGEREGRNSDGIRFGTRAAVAAAIVISLSVSAFAGVHFSGMSLKKEDGKEIKSCHQQKQYKQGPRCIILHSIGCGNT